MINTVRGSTRADHRNVVRHAGLNACPCAYNRRVAHDGKQLPYGLSAVREFAPIDLAAVFVAIRPREMAPTDHDGAVGELLKRKLARAQNHDGIDEVRH